MFNIFQALSDISFFDKVFISVLAAVILIQFFYWIRYSFILSKCFVSKKKDSDIPSVSVIVVVNENHLEWINGEMKELFYQNHPNYEVIAVNDCGGEEVSMALQRIYLENPILKYTTIQQDKKYVHTRKVALLVGIKGARFNNFIFIEPWTKPSSPNWLKNMSEGFMDGKDIVYGASLLLRSKSQSLIGCFGLMSIIRSFSFAIRKRPYRASRTNYGFTRKVFFDNGGFNYLKSSYGDNDLFLQKISKKNNFSVVIGDGCQMIRTYPGNFISWFRDELFLSSSFRFYPFRVKLSIFVELLSSFLMWTMLVTSIVKLILCVPCEDILFNSIIIYFIAIAIHQSIVLFVVGKLSRKLKMKSVLLTFFFYEKIVAVFESVLSICRHFGAPKRIW